MAITSFVFNFSAIVAYIDNTIKEIMISRDEKGNISVNDPTNYPDLMREINSSSDCFSTFPVEDLTFIFNITEEGVDTIGKPGSPAPPDSNPAKSGDINPPIASISARMSTTYTLNGNILTACGIYGGDWQLIGDQEVFDQLFAEKFDDLQLIFDIADITLLSSDGINYVLRYLFNGDVEAYGNGDLVNPLDSSGNDFSGNSGTTGVAPLESGGSLLLNNSGLFVPRAGDLVGAFDGTNGIRLRLTNVAKVGGDIELALHMEATEGDDYLFELGLDFSQELEQITFSGIIYGPDFDELTSQEENITFDVDTIEEILVEYRFSGAVNFSVNGEIVLSGNGPTIQPAALTAPLIAITGGNLCTIDEMSLEAM